MHIVASQQSTRNAAARRQTRIAPLAVLPVFFDLRDKTVLVIGGTEAAAWKAHLLAAAGARLVVHAGDLDAAFAELFPQGGFVRRGEGWSAQSFSGAALTVADIESDEEAAAFSAAAKAAGVPCNVIDKPAFCTFQFGSIVNRSPVVVGISTAGAAPILGQAVRRQIEMLLPDFLAAWAELAGRIRTRVMERLAAGAERRSFWERFAEVAFASAPESIDVERWIGQARGAPSGRVTLVGAGPGDADHLTIKAVRALQSADVILFDDLVSGEVLELARREAKRILVGKRGGRQSCRQDDINEMMVSLARQGRHVVRLKSGDPMIFGRGGEEIERLESEDIAVDVVPGITTALALAAEIKTSLTHRDWAQSVRFVTGHSRNGVLPEALDWRALADPVTTSIFYMSGRTGQEIGAKLAGAGMPGGTPVIVANNVGRRDAMHVRSSVDGLARGQIAIDIASPVIIAIGNALRERGMQRCDDEQIPRSASAT